MTRHHPLQWRPLQNPFPLEGEGWDGGGVPLFVIPAPPSSSFPRPSASGNPRPGPGASHPLRQPEQPPPSFPRPPFFVIPREGGNPRPRLPQQLSHPQPEHHTPSFPRPFFVIPAKAGTHGPDQGDRSGITPVIPRTLLRPRLPQQLSHPQRATPVIPAPLLRHSREGGNPRPRPDGKSPQHSPAPPRLSGPTVTHSQPEHHPPSFPRSFFVIPAKAGTHGPDQGASHPQSAGAPPPVIPALLLRHSREVSRSTTPVIPAKSQPGLHPKSPPRNHNQLRR